MLYYRQWNVIPCPTGRPLQVWKANNPGEPVPVLDSELARTNTFSPGKHNSPSSASEDDELAAAGQLRALLGRLFRPLEKRAKLMAAAVGMAMSEFRNTEKQQEAFIESQLFTWLERDEEDQVRAIDDSPNRSRPKHGDAAGGSHLESLRPHANENPKLRRYP